MAVAGSYQLTEEKTMEGQGWLITNLMQRKKSQRIAYIDEGGKSDDQAEDLIIR